MSVLKQKPRLATLAIIAGAVIGLVFASVSTSDFAMHLDRQVHDVHCSFVPGLTGPSQGESGCQVTLVSRYSSLWRGSVWGGVPVSLPAMGVFAFLLFAAIELVLSGRQRDRRITGLVALATVVPAVTSIVMAYLAFVELDAVCKLCIGIYAASALVAVGGITLWVGARPPQAAEAPAFATDASFDSTAPPRAVPAGPLTLAAGCVIGVLFVLLPIAAYVATAEDHSRFVGDCGVLGQPKDTYGVTLPLAPHPGAPPAIEVLDPLCPACRVFEESIRSAGLEGEMDRRAVLFPLDAECNWMLDKSLHPGACAVSEAMLCAGERAPDVLAWAFDKQAEIRGAAAKDPSAAARMVRARFPDLGACVGSPAVRTKLNRSLRWIVANQLPVLTPQLYVDGVKLCDEDVDLGLEFALPRLLRARAASAPASRSSTGSMGNEVMP